MFRKREGTKVNTTNGFSLADERTGWSATLVQMKGGGAGDFVVKATSRAGVLEFFKMANVDDKTVWQGKSFFGGITHIAEITRVLIALIQRTQNQIAADA